MSKKVRLPQRSNLRSFFGLRAPLSAGAAVLRLLAFVLFFFPAPLGAQSGSPTSLTATARVVVTQPAWEVVRVVGAGLQELALRRLEPPSGTTRPMTLAGTRFAVIRLLASPVPTPRPRRDAKAASSANPDLATLRPPVVKQPNLIVIEVNYLRN